ncbi:MAG TPA: hypothetical protein VII46_02225 [Acidimicrobiales bacterium]
MSQTLGEAQERVSNVGGVAFQPPRGNASLDAVDDGTTSRGPSRGLFGTGLKVGERSREHQVSQARVLSSEGSEGPEHPAQIADGIVGGPDVRKRATEEPEAVKEDRPQQSTPIIEQLVDGRRGGAGVSGDPSGGEVRSFSSERRHRGTEDLLFEGGSP